MRGYGHDAWLHARGPRHWREVSCPGCGFSWEIEGHEEYIYHYGNRPEEIFDLSEDPTEQNDLAGEYSQEELDKRRDELLKWQTSVNATYASMDR